MVEADKALWRGRLRRGLLTSFLDRTAMPRRDEDPYCNFRFKLELGSVEVAGFAECTGLNIETKVLEYKEGGNNSTTLKFPEVSTYGNITLKRGVTASSDLIDWQLDVATGTFEKNSRSSNPSIAITNGIRE